jgi:hypothetical protein
MSKTADQRTEEASHIAKCTGSGYLNTALQLSRPLSAEGILSMRGSAPRPHGGALLSDAGIPSQLNDGDLA